MPYCLFFCAVALTTVALPSAALAGDWPPPAELQAIIARELPAYPPWLIEFTTIGVEYMTLEELAAYIERRSGANVKIQAEILADAGVLKDARVYVRCRELPFYQFLERCLANIGGMPLEWVREDGAIWLNTAERCKSPMSTQLHNCRTLLEAGWTRSELEKLVANHTTGPWLDVDGLGGTADFYRQAMVVRQTDSMHTEISQILQQLETQDWSRHLGETTRDRLVREAAQAPVTLHAEDVPLRSLPDHLQPQLPCEFMVIDRLLGDMGIDPNSMVNVSATNRPLQEVVQEMVPGGVNVTLGKYYGALCMTEIGCESLYTRILDVSDLADTQADVEILLDCIKEHSQGPWLDVDGLGGTADIARNNLLIIRQEERTFADTEQLLAEFRRLKEVDGDWRPADEIVTRFYTVSPAPADDLIRIIPLLVAPGTWNSQVNADDADSTPVLQQIRLPVDVREKVVQEGFSNFHEVVDERLLKKHELLKKEFDVHPRSMLIVRHRESIQRQVRKLVDQLGEETADPVPANPADGQCSF